MTSSSCVVARLQAGVVLELSADVRDADEALAGLRELEDRIGMHVARQRVPVLAREDIGPAREQPLMEGIGHGFALATDSVDSAAGHSRGRGADRARLLRR